MVTRSVLEGSLKCAYLLQSMNTFDARHTEFAEHLFDIGRAKDHEKARSFFDGIPNPDDERWKPIRDLLLSEEEITSIRGQFNKEQRRELERKWGFSGLTNFMSRSDDPFFSGFNSFGHGYSTASHLLHADVAGVAIPIDRDYRSIARRETAHLAHLSRLITDAFVAFKCRLVAGYRCVGADTQKIAEDLNRIDTLLQTHGNIHAEWTNCEYGG